MLLSKSTHNFNEFSTTYTNLTLIVFIKNEVWSSSTYDFSNHVEFDWVNLICYAFISFIYKKKKKKNCSWVRLLHLEFVLTMKRRQTNQELVICRRTLCFTIPFIIHTLRCTVERYGLHDLFFFFYPLASYLFHIVNFFIYFILSSYVDLI